MNPPDEIHFQPPITRRRFMVAALAGAATSPVLLGEEAGDSPELGPIVGHTECDRCVIWMRAKRPGNYRLELVPGTGGRKIEADAVASAETDLCLHWKLQGLTPATSYRYRIVSGGKLLAGGEDLSFSTPPAPGQAAKVRFAISSCALEDKASREVWSRMAGENIDAVMLIGDTPYIDSTDLAVQTRRHREFAAVPEYQKLLRSRPCWWTWDDHDFAANNSNGGAAGKENSRTVYCRYRPQWNHGKAGQGIYTSFRYGPVEVFLLDARWFSMTGPSHADPGKPTLLGKEQWEWLKAGLLASTASFKFLACGMIWDDKENRENDDWGTYMHERAALERWIAEHRIPGVVLMGGDIHASRVLRYKTEKTVGYNMVQFIASPIHHKVIPSLNVYHPDLVRSAVEPNVFLIVEVDSTITPAALHAELVNRHGERVFTYNLTLDDLTPA